MSDEKRPLDYASPETDAQLNDERLGALGTLIFWMSMLCVILLFVMTIGSALGALFN